jgi:hypothetical protein
MPAPGLNGRSLSRVNFAGRMAFPRYLIYSMLMTCEVGSTNAAFRTTRPHFSVFAERYFSSPSMFQTHPVFDVLTKRHIYADIIVNNGEIPVSELRIQFSENPHIMNFVCSMTFDLSEVLSTAVLQETLAILSMLPRMVKLTSIEIYGPSGGVTYESFRSLLEFALCRSSASEVCLRGIHGFHCRPSANAST